MLINSVFANNLTEAKSYYNSLNGLLKNVKDKEKILPYYYYIDKDQLDLERLEPGSQDRQSSPEVEEGSAHLWTQSLWFICQILGLK
jgi:hypothetical protein